MSEFDTQQFYQQAIEEAKEKTSNLLEHDWTTLIAKAMIDISKVVNTYNSSSKLFLNAIENVLWDLTEKVESQTKDPLLKAYVHQAQENSANILRTALATTNNMKK